MQDSDEPIAGAFISIEGVDGSGKSTIAAKLARAMRDAGLPVVLTREPGGTAIGEAIREILLGVGSGGMLPRAEALLFAAARAQHVAEVIRPALAQGTNVVTDRYTDSSLAYQWGGRGLPRELLDATQRLATGGLTPGLTLLLDVPVELALGRRLGGAGETNRLDLETVEFHERVRAAYHALVEEDRGRWWVVDAARAEDEVLQEALRGVNEARLLSAILRCGPGAGSCRGAS